MQQVPKHTNENKRECRSLFSPLIQIRYRSSRDQFYSIYYNLLYFIVPCPKNIEIFLIPFTLTAFEKTSIVPKYDFFSISDITHLNILIHKKCVIHSSKEGCAQNSSFLLSHEDFIFFYKKISNCSGSLSTEYSPLIT